MRQNGMAHGYPANHAANSTINIVHQYGQINMVTLQTQCEVFCKKQGGGDNRKQKNKKNNTNKKEQKRDENWKKTPPKEGEPHKKKVKGRTWRWCKHHMAWGNHKEDSVDSAMSAPTSKPMASTKLQPKLPQQPSSTPSGKPS